MTMPAELARAWGPMWRKGYDPERPWWVAVNGGYLRCDGWLIEGCFMWRVVNFAPPNIPDRFDDARQSREWLDTNHPLPAPDPMSGQVWVSAGGTQCMIAAAWCSGGSWWVQWASNPGEPKRWEPPTSVLVAGPTPWGRDVPWAPMGGA